MKRNLLPLLLATALLATTPAIAFDFNSLGDALGLDKETTKRLEEAAKVVSALVPISEEEEKILGRDVAARVAGRFGIDPDQNRTYYLNLLGTALAQHSDRPNLGYHFAILNTDDVNAYSCPGGYIFVTRGAMNMAQDEAELAAILSHEIAHVTEKHILKALQKSKLMQVGSEVAAEAFKNQGSQLFKQMSDFATDALFKGLSKEDEFDADRVSVVYLNRTGYDYLAMNDVLKLLDARRKRGMTKVLAKTHPNPTVRLQQLTAAERTLPLDAPTGIRLKQRFVSYTQSNKNPS
ncbi:MAG TPA: M48 family metalloprotease [Mariprofundaceae bacterium]|nr:M48 family metalloprotease [Mariprofundaceae bacterium]